MNILPFSLDASVGEVYDASEELPGLYDIETSTGAYYVLQKSHEDVLPETIRRYGTWQGDVLYFREGKERGGWELVEVELYLRKVKEGAMTADDAMIDAFVANCRFDYPEYFGEYPPPRLMPGGDVTRIIRVDNGIYLMEATNGRRMLSVTYPYWFCISKPSLFAAEWLDGDKTALDLFLPLHQCAPCVFELLTQWHLPGLLGCITSEEALIAAIWQQAPQYVQWYNSDANIRRTLHRQKAHSKYLRQLNLPPEPRFLYWPIPNPTTADTRFFVPL